MDDRYQVQSWPEMDAWIGEQIEEFRKIKSGVHIALLGTTRGGKTTLVTGGGNADQGILRHFENALVLDTTGDPGAISSYGKPVQKFGAIRGHRRLTLSDMNTEGRDKILKYLRRAMAQKNVAIYADELRQLTEKKYFNLGPLMDRLWLFYAKQGISLIGGTQAPRWIPGAFYDQSKMHFIFHMRDKRSMMRLAEISGDTDLLRTLIPGLERWQFAHVDMYGDTHVSKFELRKRQERESDPAPQKSLSVTRERRLFIRQES